MPLLPKSKSDFRAKSYWENFFRARSDAFEWYGDYAELCGFLHKYCKASDRILVSGCGNSKLSEDLYDVGYEGIVNVDISETVISQMRMKNALLRPSMKYMLMNMTKTSFDDEEFAVVLDKGTLDAMLPDTTEAAVADVRQMFAEIYRILKVGGRYICVTLAQGHILNELLSFFPSLWIVRAHCKVQQQRGNNNDRVGVGAKLPVFVFVMTKMKMPLPRPVLETCFSPDVDAVKKLESIERMREEISQMQNYAFVQDKLEKSSLDECLSIDLWNPLVQDAKEPRYTVTLVDRAQSTCPAGAYAVFIVPQGRESEWMFSSDSGRKQLADQAGFRRLAIVTLHRGHTYSSLDEVKSELSANIMELVPPGITKHARTPFLTAGEDVGYRRVQFEGSSPVTGDYIVEDAQTEDGTYVRRLIFRDSINVVQTEARLVADRPSKKSKKKKAKDRVVDHAYLVWEINQAAMVSFAFLPDFKPDCATSLSILIIGVGGGALPSFIAKTFPQCCLTCVDLDGEVIGIAKTWFALKETSNVTCVAQDGLLFMQEMIDRGSRGVYDIVILDINCADTNGDLCSPPDSFLEKNALENVKSLLKTQGVLFMNSVRRTEEKRRCLMALLRKHFANCYQSPLHEGNVPVFCPCGPASPSAALARVQERLAGIQRFISDAHSGKLNSGNFDIVKIGSLLEKVAF